MSSIRESAPVSEEVGEWIVFGIDLVLICAGLVWARILDQLR
jgi:hypothetical protein